jgi:hypothetical protein
LVLLLFIFYLAPKCTGEDGIESLEKYSRFCLENQEHLEELFIGVLEGKFFIIKKKKVEQEVQLEQCL